MIVDFNLLCQLLGRHSTPSNKMFRQRVVREYKQQVSDQFPLSPLEYTAFAELVAGISFVCERLGLTSVLNICQQLQQAAQRVICVEIEHLGRLEAFDLEVYQTRECEMTRVKFSTMLFAIHGRKASVVNTAPFVELYDVRIPSCTVQFDIHKFRTDIADVWHGIEEICTTGTISRTPSPALTV